MPDETEVVEPSVGRPDGFVLDDGETVVYDYDNNGKFIGWHKAPGDAGPHPTENPTGEEQPIVPDPNEPAADPPNESEGN